MVVIWMSTEPRKAIINVLGISGAPRGFPCRGRKEQLNLSGWWQRSIRRSHHYKTKSNFPR